jgi:predicted AAA+ superfamily ATPase
LNIKGNKYFESIRKFYAVGTDKYYIQSAFALDDEEKRQQELNSLLRIDDSFRKVVIVGSDIAEYTDDKGIRFMGLFQFLQSGL